MKSAINWLSRKGPKEPWLHEKRKKPIPRKPSSAYERVVARDERAVFGVLMSRLDAQGRKREAAHWRERAYCWQPRDVVAAARREVSNAPTREAA